jgi:hypothetical protein
MRRGRSLCLLTSPTRRAAGAPVARRTVGGRTSILETISPSGRHVGLLVHVPRAASVVHNHGPLTIASAINGGGQTPYEPATPAIQPRTQPLGLRP